MTNEPKNKLLKKNESEDIVIKDMFLKEMIKQIEEKIDNNDSIFLRTLKTMIRDEKKENNSKS
jgi:hypothetical protein